MTMLVTNDTSDGRNGTNAWDQEDIVSSEYNVTTTASGAASKTSHFETDLHGNVNILLGGWAFTIRSNFWSFFKKCVLTCFQFARIFFSPFSYEQKSRRIRSDLNVCPLNRGESSLWIFIEQLWNEIIGEFLSRTSYLKLLKDSFKYFSTIPWQVSQ